MTKKIYIIDLIGIHSGTHYYHESFAKIFENEQNIYFHILSNYNNGNKSPFFKNFFNHTTAINVIRLIQGWFKLLFFILSNRKSYFIYQTYGTLFDPLFLFLTVLNRKRFIADVQEIYDLAKPPAPIVKKSFNLIYKYIINTVILHSEKNLKYIKEIGFSRCYIMVPHFRYITKMNSEKSNIDIKIKKLFIDDKINILFFGHIRLSKGIDILYDLFNNIQNTNITDKINIIIVGNDSDNIIEKKSLTFKDEILQKKLLRRVSDEELDFIFKKSDYLILPYKEISQSGVLEMAIKYKKPLLLSEIDEFINYLTQFNSFGHLFSLTDLKKFENLLLSIIINPPKYYSSIDLSNYLNEDAFKKFKSEFINFLSIK